MKTNSTLFKKKPFVLPAFFAFIVLFFIVLIDGCKKADFTRNAEPASEEDFFNAPENSSPTVEKVIAAFKRQNSITGFVKQLVAEEGMPLWENSIIEINRNLSCNGYRSGGNSDTEDTLVFTPIVLQDSNIVNGFLMSKIMNDSVELHLYRANDYDKHPYGNVNADTLTAEKISLTLMELNAIVFGHTKFKITDSLLFRQDYRSVSEPEIERIITLKTTGGSPSDGLSRLVVSSVEICTIYTCPPENSSRGENGSNNITIPCFNCQIIVIIGGTYEWPPETPIPTGGGGGGGQNNPSPGNNCTGSNTCGQQPSLIEQGKLPCGGCGTPPIVVVPVVIEPEPFPNSDSLLANLSRAINRKADSIFTLSTQQNKNEWGMIIVRKNGTIYGKNEKTGNNPDYVKFNWFLISGEELMGDLHVHNDADSLGRSSFSGEDLTGLRRNKDKYQYTSFVECGNVRFALVIEDVAKANAFFATRPNNRAVEKAIFDSAYSHPQAYTNWQYATQAVLASYIGSSSVSGIGFYKSNNADKTSYTKLN